MNFLLKNIEIALSENHLVVGEKILDAKGVTSLFESERNLWIAKVDGFEVEIQITPSKVRACSCECPIYHNEKMCGHVAAGLFELRKKLTQKKAAANKKRKLQKTYGKLTTNSILEEVGVEELQAFVRHYAKKNRQFNIALQTRFAGSVTLNDNDAKYRQVIDAILKSSRTKSNSISITGAKQILSTSEDLLGQANDAIALEHFLESWSVLYALLDKVVPLVNKLTNEAGAFIDFTDNVYAALESLISHPLIPPDLKENVWEALLQIVTKPGVRGYDRAVGMLKLLLTLADDRAKRSQLLQLVDQEEKKANMLSEPHKNQLMACRLIIYSKRGFKAISKTYYQAASENPEQILNIVKIAIKNSLFDTAKQVAEMGLKIYDNALFQYQLKAYLVDVSIAQKAPDEIVSHAKFCFNYSGKLKYLQLCKQYYKGDWVSFRSALVNEIKSQNHKMQSEMLADLYAADGELNALSKILSECNDIEMLMKYDGHFLPHNQKKLEALYIEILDRYFSNHFGIKPTQKLLKIFAHLRSQKGDALVEKLATFVRKKHPQRLELAMEMLSL